MILVINKDNMRLCQDRKWRSFANFGTYPACVKVYKSQPAAEKCARRVGGKILVLQPSQGMNAAGQIFHLEDGREIYEGMGHQQSGSL